MRTEDINRALEETRHTLRKPPDDELMQEAEADVKQRISSLMLAVTKHMQAEEGVPLLYMIGFYYLSMHTLTDDDFAYISSRALKLTEKIME